MQDEKENARNDSAGNINETIGNLQDRDSESNRISVLRVSRFVKDEKIIKAFKYLRDLSPIRETTYLKLITPLVGDKSAFISALQDASVIKIFTSSLPAEKHKSSNEQESSVNFILLIVDIAGFFKPSIHVTLINQSNPHLISESDSVNGLLSESGGIENIYKRYQKFPQDLKREYIYYVQKFFKNIKLNKNIGDNLKAFEIYNDDLKYSVLQQLNKRLYKSKNIIHNLIKEIYPSGNEAYNGKEYKQYERKIEETLNFFKSDKLIAEIGDYTLPLIDIELKIFFPEYLVDKITQRLNSNSLDKELAIKSLMILKNSYYINFHKKEFERIKKNIDELKISLETLKTQYNDLNESASEEQAAKEPLLKDLSGVLDKLIKLFDQIGDYDEKNKYEKELLEIISG